MPGRVCALVALLACMAACMGACARHDGTQPLVWAEALPGLGYARAAVADAEPPAVHLVRFQADRYETVVVPAAAAGRRLTDAAEFLRAAGGVVAVNAGYFDPEFRPLGLLVSRGRELSRLRRVDHGVFYVAGGRPGLVHARSWQRPDDLEFAVECGPRLVVAGRPLSFKPGQARRVAIGHDGDGAVVLAVSEGELSLAEFADLLARPAARGGAGLAAALNLDGGSSTMLEIALGDLRVRVPAPLQVPVGLAVVPRNARAAIQARGAPVPSRASPALDAIP